MGIETKVYGNGAGRKAAATPVDGEDKAQNLSDRRRCKRLSLSFPIEVSGTDHTGIPFDDRTVTNDVSEEGCRFDLLRPLRCGDVVTLRVVGRDSNDVNYGPALRFEVVWVETSDRGWVIGATKLQPENIWHMTFPKNKNSPAPR